MEQETEKDIAKKLKEKRFNLYTVIEEALNAEPANNQKERFNLYTVINDLMAGRTDELENKDNPEEESKE